MNALATKAHTVVALDAMGGDHAPRAILIGAEKALEAYNDVHFLIYGDEEKLKSHLSDTPLLKSSASLIHTSEVVEDNEKPTTAIRRGRRSSMGQAIQAVRNKQAKSAVSCGNTGALMAMSKIMLGMLPGIERPAIGALLPHNKGKSVMLDLGANVTCDADNLFEFAIMGHAFARSILKIENPSIGLLNVGEEDMKGHEVVKTAAELIRESDVSLNFRGYIEGNDILEGVVDVIVTDGFTGNIALKTAEGTAKMVSDRFKQCFKSSLMAQFGALLAAKALSRMKHDIDPSRHNGAMFLGLNGIIIKSHGRSDEIANYHAIKLAIELAKDGVNEQIVHEMIDSGHVPPDEFMAQINLEATQEKEE